MIHFFIKDHHSIIKQSFDIHSLPARTHHVLWVDLLHANAKEINHIATLFDLIIPTHEEREEIEESSRYSEGKDEVMINTYFMIANIKEGWKMYSTLQNQTITFLFHANVLFTIRYSELRTFDEAQNNLILSPEKFSDGFDVFGKIFEYRIEKDADILEKVARDTQELRSGIFEHRCTSEEFLNRLGQLQDFHMQLRGSLFDKRRSLSALLKSEKISKELKEDLEIVLKDIISLIDFTHTNMMTLDNIQNLFSNQINIEQNKVIKFFTVITVAFMPPTLVGTIYGMNFHHMPELQWQYGYPIAIAIMCISVIMPLMYFKLKKWL